MRSLILLAEAVRVVTIHKQLRRHLTPHSTGARIARLSFVGHEPISISAEEHCMAEETAVDHYEVLQVSPNAEPETINRVYRMLAQRFHPDNQQTGDERRFHTILEAYTVLSDPEKRARYDVVHEQQRQDRWRLVASGAQVENDFELEQV